MLESPLSGRGTETKGVKPEAGGKLEAGSGERGQRSGLREVPGRGWV